MPMVDAIPVPELGTTPATDSAIPDAPAETTLPPKKTRRRRTKDATSTAPDTTPAPQPVQVSAEDKRAIADALLIGFGVLFDIIAARRGAHWRLERVEAQRLGTVWAEPLAPWLAANAKYMPFAIAGLATVGVIMPRLQADQALITAETTTQQTEATGNGTEPPATPTE